MLPHGNLNPAEPQAGKTGVPAQRHYLYQRHRARCIRSGVPGKSAQPAQTGRMDARRSEDVKGRRH